METVSNLIYGITKCHLATMCVIHDSFYWREVVSFYVRMLQERLRLLLTHPVFERCSVTALYEASFTWSTQYVWLIFTLFHYIRTCFEQVSIRQYVRL